MTDPDVNRALGRLEGKVEGMAATLSRVDMRSAARDEAFDVFSDRLGALEEHAKSMVQVTNQFNALQQAIRDGKMQGKGILIGISLAGGAGGAAAATFFKGLWAFFFGQ